MDYDNQIAIFGSIIQSEDDLCPHLSPDLKQNLSPDVLRNINQLNHTTYEEPDDPYWLIKKIIVGGLLLIIFITLLFHNLC